MNTIGVKQSIVTRVRVAFLFVCLFSVAVVWKVTRIQFVEGDKWKKLIRSRTYSYQPVRATRGNIYSDNESILATSLPFYRVAWDPSVVDEALFDANVDSLAWQLAHFFNDKPVETYRRKLINARKGPRPVRYLRLNNKQVNYQEKKQIAHWPIFRKGQHKGGVIFEKVDRRFRPFGELAQRTIGYISEGKSGAGLEYTFNDHLAGRDGEALFEKIAGGWRPVFDGSEIKPVPGYDLVTTLDINLQDVAETALRRALVVNNAAYGTVVLMEVKTGQIKAIANLGRKKPGEYVEDYNYAIANQGLTEPGSTFKLASMMALFEDNPDFKLTDTVNTGSGRMMIGGAVKTDTHGHGRISYQQVFEMSSNVGVAKLIWDNFKDKQARYTELVHSFGLGQRLGLQMGGEAQPVVKTPENRSWSRTSLSTMSIGYEVKLAPIHTLSFYNAVANNGVKMRPYLVKEIRQADKVVQHFEPVVLKQKICSEATLTKLKKMMEGVVSSPHGTGKRVRSPDYKVAGKTGTAWKLENGHYVKKYITSFVGYFPAEAPKYSAIVLIDSPTAGRIYGGDVAAPVFRELADKAFALDPARQAEMNGHTPDTTKAPLPPYVRAGQQEELTQLCARLGIKDNARLLPDEWVRARPETTLARRASVKPTVTWQRAAITPGTVPNVVGLSLRDALFLLGNQGLQVQTTGFGHVTGQSLAPGTRAPVGTVLHLVLKGPLPLESLYVAPAPALVAAAKGLKPLTPLPVRGRVERDRFKGLKELPPDANTEKPAPGAVEDLNAVVAEKKAEKEAAKKTETGKAITKKASTKPTVKKPSPKKPTAKKPAAHKPTVKKAEAKAGGKAAAKKKTADKPDKK